MLRRVFTKVMVYPFFFSNSSANAKKGMIWPCAMNGNITMFSFLSVISLLREREREGWGDGFWTFHKAVFIGFENLILGFSWGSH